MESKPPSKPPPEQMPSDVRTVIGVPSLQAGQLGSSQRPPPPRPERRSAPPRPAPDLLVTPQFPWGKEQGAPPPAPSMEELSASALVDDDESAGQPFRSPFESEPLAPAMVPTDVAADEDEEPREPQGPQAAPYPWMQPAFDRFPALERVQRGKPKLFLPVLGSIAVFAVLIVGAAAIKAATGKRKTVEPALAKSAAPTASASASSLPPATTSAAPVATEVPPPPVAAAAAGPCVIAGEPKTIAPQIVLASGVEAVRSGRGISLGFASDPKNGAVVTVDPKTLNVVAKAAGGAKDVIRRVTPVGGATVTVATDIDRKGDPLDGRRTASSGAAIDIGRADGHLAWAKHNTDKSSPLWPLDGDAPVEALRAIALEGDRGQAITFRRSGAIWQGAIDSKFGTAGDLTSVAGLGAQIGSPVIGSSGDVVLTVWADRANASDPFHLRWQRWKPGQAPEPAKDFSPPEGGLGAPFMSPGIAGLGGGRFLVAWTEGPFSNHQVRALTIDASGKPEGPPLMISKEGVNAGQGQAAIMVDGNGVVAYLVAKGQTFELAATPIRCPVL
jgi:hypothetical protein